MRSAETLSLTTRDHADDAVNAIIPHWPLSLLVTAILTLWFCGVLLDMALEYIVLVRRVRRRSKGWSATAFSHVIVFVMVSCVLVLCALNTQQMFMQVMRSYKLELTISPTLRAEIAFFSIVDTLALCVAVSRVWIHSYNNVIWTSALALISLVSVACYFAVLGLSFKLSTFDWTGSLLAVGLAFVWITLIANSAVTGSLVFLHWSQLRTRTEPSSRLELLGRFVFETFLLVACCSFGAAIGASSGPSNQTIYHAFKTISPAIASISMLYSVNAQLRAECESLVTRQRPYQSSSIQPCVHVPRRAPCCVCARIKGTGSNLYPPTVVLGSSSGIARQIAVEVFVSESDSTGPIERVAQVPAPRGPAQPRASDVGSLCSEVSVVHRDRIATSTDRHSETTSDETRD